ncbi:steroidogenic factor 1-like isoform X2 [Babylonia areolata]|uniref:steroidogenic factor 1-like isoform X2 n=1 Tax=Babylonia areolata TaxID=304850 RepID=UPI003FD08DD0
MTSNMSLTGDVGISPVLLQAISLKSSESQPDRLSLRQDSALVMERQQQQQQQQESSKVVSHLLQGMNEPVSALLSSSAPLGTATSELQRERGVGGKPEEVLLNASIQERLATQLALKQARVVTAATVGGSPGADVSMVNVLTALASQHRRASVKHEEPETTFTSILQPHTPTTAPAITTVTTSTPAAAADVVVRTSSDSGDERSQPQIIIYYNNGSGSVPSPANDVIVGEVEGDVGVQRSVQNYRVVMHHGEMVAGGPTVTTLSDPAVHMITEAAAATAAVTGGETCGTFVAPDSSNSSETLMGNCPVCGDKLSGYHYGVFTCESCKGFFKRTVQNKKSFLCHKQGNCEVNVFNRKKCPACRFTKCLQAGMKLEAIRQDRTRGGRSSYDGCSPHNKPRPSSLQKKVKRPSGPVVREEGNGCPEVVSPLPEVQLVGAKEEGKGHRQLVAILNHSNMHGQQVADGQGKRVPELLTDIMNLEALLTDDDIPQEGAEGDDPTEEQALYNHLMQLTELRLYKLVRWARNLPQFGAISTDDQILLLQNCWSDLLALGVCWRSVGTPGVLSISATRSIAPEQAEALGFGDVVSRLMSITQSLRNLHVDQYEYVALKVLLLITPDVKGLKEPGKIHEYQEKLSDALMEYTASHYLHLPSKLGEMLLRLPELARVSFLAKEILLLALPPSSSSCGLLVELLKGENAVKE